MVFHGDDRQTSASGRVIVDYLPTLDLKQVSAYWLLVRIQTQASTRKGSGYLSAIRMRVPYAKHPVASFFADVQMLYVADASHIMCLLRLCTSGRGSQVAQISNADRYPFTGGTSVLRPLTGSDILKVHLPGKIECDGSILSFGHRSGKYIYSSRTMRPQIIAWNCEPLGHPSLRLVWGCMVKELRYKTHVVVDFRSTVLTTWS